MTNDPMTFPTFAAQNFHVYGLSCSNKKCAYFCLL